MGQSSACDDGYIGVNDGFSECDVSMGGGTGEDDGASEDVQMWCKCVSKYGICDINTIVNINLSFTIAEMSHVQYLHTHLHHI